MRKIDVVVATANCYMQNPTGDWYIKQLIQEDNYLVEALQRLGLSAIREAWDNPNFDWSCAKSVVLRTTWNYSQKFPQFFMWLQNVSQNCILLNPLEVIHWNIQKTYLQDLKNNGVCVVDTIFADSHVELIEIMQRYQWKEIIIKPVISGGAFHTYRISQENYKQYENLWRELQNERRMMIQPFQREITNGEISCIIIGGRFSHAIRKIPKTGDFRVQDEHGGKVEIYSPLPEEIQFAEQVIATIRFSICYARVDFVRDNQGKLAVMELELIEPELFFRFRPESARELATTIANSIN